MHKRPGYYGSGSAYEAARSAAGEGGTNKNVSDMSPEEFAEALARARRFEGGVNVRRHD